jgi:hypothetical protein
MREKATWTEDIQQVSCVRSLGRYADAYGKPYHVRILSYNDVSPYMTATKSEASNLILAC